MLETPRQPHLLDPPPLPLSTVVVRPWVVKVPKVASFLILMLLRRVVHDNKVERFRSEPCISGETVSALTMESCTGSMTLLMPMLCV
jgi:hypothetical protein